MDLNLRKGEALTIEVFRTTRAYTQIKRWIKRHNGSPAQLGVVVKKAIKNYNNHAEEFCLWQDVPWRVRFNKASDLTSMFPWDSVPEDKRAWGAVYHGGAGLDHFFPRKEKAIPADAINPGVHMPGGFFFVEKVNNPEPAPVVKPAVGWW